MACALSRAAAVGLLGWVRPAADEGLGAAYAASVSRRRAVGAAGVGLSIGLACLA